MECFWYQFKRWDIDDAIGTINIAKDKNDAILHANWIDILLSTNFLFVIIKCNIIHVNQVQQKERETQKEKDKQAAYVVNMEVLLLFSLWFMCFPSVLVVKLACVVILAQKEILYIYNNIIMLTLKDSDILCNKHNA